MKSERFLLCEPWGGPGRVQGVHRRGGYREEELRPQSCFPVSVPEERGGAGLWSPSPGAQLDTCLPEFTPESLGSPESAEPA